MRQASAMEWILLPSPDMAVRAVSLTAVAFALSLLTGVTVHATESSAPPPADRADMTGRRELQMMQCPSASPGAITTARDVPHGVELTVRAGTEWQRREVQRRARIQASVGQARSHGHIEHTGRGTGTGRFGFCPGILDGTRYAVRDLPVGARIRVTAADPHLVEELRTSTRARIDRLQRERSSARR